MRASLPNGPVAAVFSTLFAFASAIATMGMGSGCTGTAPPASGPVDGATGTEPIPDASSGGDASTSAPTSDLECTQAATAFAAKPFPFTLPAARCGSSFDAMSATGAIAYTLRDVNADRRPDIVVNADSCDDEIGVKRWDVYLASADGFAKTPAPFTLPAARCGKAFDQVAGAGALRYALFDVNADRRADLVVTGDDCDPEVGTTRWDVYVASDEGFSRTPTGLALPAPRCEARFDAFAGNGTVRYTLLDFDADRRPDLVVTSDACDRDVGTKRWDVYTLSDAGFAKTPASFTLPAPRCSGAFDNITGRSRVSYVTMDLDADRVPDLVVTADACDEEIGRKRWDAYLASSAGFAKTPVPFGLPAARCGRSFDATASPAGDVRYALLDFSCDGRSDLVVTSDACDQDVGAKRWDVYVASESGFSPKPYALGVPAGRCGDRFDALGGRAETSYGLLDMSADGRTDIVVTSDSCDPVIGESRWEIYPLE